MPETEARDRDARIKGYEELFTIGLYVVAGGLALLSGAEKVRLMLTTLAAGAPTVRSILPVVLFVQTLLLGVAWYVSGKHELSILTKYYRKHAPSRSFATLPVVIFAAGFVVVLSYYADNILVFSSVYVVYVLTAVSAGWLSSQHVMKAFLSASTDGSIPTKYREEVYRYYVLRPGAIVGYVCGAGTFASITFASLAKYGPAIERQRFETTAYFVMMGTILFGEVTVWSWRARLYSRTRDL